MDLGHDAEHSRACMQVVLWPVWAPGDKQYEATKQSMAAYLLPQSAGCAPEANGPATDHDDPRDGMALCQNLGHRVLAGEDEQR